MELSPTILTEEVARPSIRFGVLKWHKQVEHFDDLGANGLNRASRNDEDEVVAADVTDEPLLTAHPFHDVMQYTSQYANHTVAFVIAVSVVEFLEVIQVRIRDA